MRSQEEITRLINQLDSILIVTANGERAPLYSAIALSLSAMSLSLEWILGTKQGDKLSLLIATLKDVQTRYTELN